MSTVLICVQDEILLPTRATPFHIWWSMFTPRDFGIDSWEIYNLNSWIKCYIPLWWCGVITPTTKLWEHWLLIVWGVKYLNPNSSAEIKIQIVNLMDDTILVDKNEHLFDIHFQPYLIGDWAKRDYSEPLVEIVADRELFKNFDRQFI